MSYPAWGTPSPFSYQTEKSYQEVKHRPQSTNQYKMGLKGLLTSALKKYSIKKKRIVFFANTIGTPNRIKKSSLHKKFPFVIYDMKDLL